MLDDFLIRATLAAIGLSFAVGPLGCFIVWRRMAYFGDATAHAAVLGIALSLAFSMSIFFGVLAAALVMATSVAGLAGRTYSSDTLLGVISHAALACGLVAAALLTDQRVDLMSYLFGEILAVSRMDLAVIWFGAALVLALLVWRWSSLLTTTVNVDLAHASGVQPEREQLVLNLAIATVIAVSIQVVGALLITAFLIIPAAAARAVSRTPEHMAIWATLIAIFSSIVGIILSFQFDTPTGPTIVATASAIFAITNLAR